VLTFPVFVAGGSTIYPLKSGNIRQNLQRPASAVLRRAAAIRPITMLQQQSLKAVSVLYSQERTSVQANVMSALGLNRTYMV
jgi:hypothetical protein